MKNDKLLLKLGKSLIGYLSDWMMDIIELYCDSEGIEDILEKLNEIDSKAVVKYCEDHLDMIAEEDFEDEAERRGMIWQQ